MKSRVYTSIVFVLVMIGGIYLSRYTFVLLFGVIAASCLWEFFNVSLMQGRVRKIIGMALGMTPYLIVALYQLTAIEAQTDSLISILLLSIPVTFLFFLYEMTTKSEKPFLNVATTILGIIYIGIPFTMLEWIALDVGYYPNVVFGLVLLNWINDTAAYLSGSKIGKTPLIPRISPKKTWEGTISGAKWTLITCFGVIILMPDLRPVDWAVLAFIVIIFGTLGDLVESMLKRSSDAKDSGSFLPGHGGLLDRFDSFIFILPFATIYIMWIRGF
jgi:phosphatidate cytidylyltransferase